MPRKFFKRFTLQHSKVREHRLLSMFGAALHEPNLWHINRRSTAGAFSVGLFFAWVPIPFQMVMAAGAAILLKTNLPLSVSLVWITNPFTIPPMFYFAYLVGTWIIGVPIQDFAFELSFDWLKHELVRVWKPFLTGCFTLATLCSIVGYVTISRIWTYAVLKERAERKGKRP